MVDRPPPRSLLTDEFGLEIVPDEVQQPAPPSPTSTTVTESIPSPRPYVPRRGSSTSSLMSPTVPESAPATMGSVEFLHHEYSSGPASPIVRGPVGANGIRPSLSRIRTGSGELD